MTATFPHCDPKVLHAAGECEFCDLHPDLQALRLGFKENFTGHGPDAATVDRPLDVIEKWHGNIASNRKPVPGCFCMYCAPYRYGMPETPTDLILAEQARQVAKWGDQRTHPDDTWFRILAEELGEVAMALNDREPDEALEAEIVQVAAVCATWLESRWSRLGATEKEPEYPLDEPPEGWWT